MVSGHLTRLEGQTSHSLLLPADLLVTYETRFKLVGKVLTKRCTLHLFLRASLHYTGIAVLAEPPSINAVYANRSRTSAS